MTKLPLDGIKVADFAQGLAGPHVSHLLAQNGADIIKIEPLIGDWVRRLGPRHGDMSGFYYYYNRGKRSIALDLKSPDGLALAHKIASQADVVVESFRPGVMSRFGLGYDALSKNNPDLVYLSVTGFGQSGKNANRPAMDSVIQSAAGIMWMNRDAKGIPQRFPVPVIDVIAGHYGFEAVMAALMQRFRHGGGGKFIDCSLMQCGIALQANRLLEFTFGGGQIAELTYVPVGAFQTKDGFINLSVTKEALFPQFCKAIEREDLGADPRYKDRVGRVALQDELLPIIRAELLKRTNAEWSERFTANDILHSPICSYGDLLKDAEYTESGYFDWIPTSDVPGPLPVANIPGAPRARETHERSQPPRIGEHTKAILSELGYRDDEIVVR